MLLGFISLLLTVLQSSIIKICVPNHVVLHLLPCSLSHESQHLRRLLAEEEAVVGDCIAKVINLFYLNYFLKYPDS